MKFKGEQCPVCSKRFSDSDDVVVCPECGTPHHRSCHRERNECANASRHGEGGFEWKSRLAGIITALEEKERRDESEREKLREEALRRETEDFEKRDVYGVSRAELSAYMQIPADTYEYRLKIAHIRKISFNFFAGLLAPFYQFYKGMRLFGFLVMLLMFSVNLPVFLSVYFDVKTLFNFFARLLGSEDSASGVLSSVQFAQWVLLVIFNDYIYLRFCARKIRKIRKSHPDGGDVYYDELRAKGAPSMGRAFGDAFVASLVIAAAVFAIVTAIFPDAAARG
ncbi:MAG: hypothetical protein LBI38_00815 [Oscillospiraceae bacterium]|nr:hypothetical protein [Oscillospiraceae bacterium]